MRRLDQCGMEFLGVGERLELWRSGFSKPLTFALASAQSSLADGVVRTCCGCDCDEVVCDDGGDGAAADDDAALPDC